MTTHKQKALAKWWSGVYQYHQVALQPANALAYARDVLNYSNDELNGSWVKYRDENRRAPMPCDLKALMDRRVSIEDQAQYMAQTLFQCVSYYSKRAQSYEDAAHKWIDQHVGRLGWVVVQQLGGWYDLWNRSGDLKPEMSIGAWRKMFDALMAAEELGGPISLPTEKEAIEFLDKMNYPTVDFKKRQANDHEN